MDKIIEDIKCLLKLALYWALNEKNSLKMLLNFPHINWRGANDGFLPNLFDSTMEGLPTMSMKHIAAIIEDAGHFYEMLDNLCNW